MKIIINTLLFTFIFFLQISGQVSFKISTDKNTYSYGEVMEVKTSLTNNTDSSLSLYGSSTCLMQLRFNSINFLTPCTNDYYDFSLPPGSSRTWIWKLDPASLGIPDQEGNQTITAFCGGRKDLYYTPSDFFMKDSIRIRAVRYYGGILSVGIKPFIPKAEVQRLRDSLNATVINSYTLSDSTTIESWQVVKHSIDSAAQFYSKDYRLLFIETKRILNRFSENNTITPPAAPVLLFPSDKSIGQPLKLKFSWKISPSANLYRFQLSSDSLFAGNFVIDSTTYLQSIQTGGLLTGMKYFWRVDAGNYSGMGKFSKAYSFITILPPPDSLKARARDFGKIELSWNDRTITETGFILERKTSEEESFKTLVILKPNAVVYNDTTVLPSITYSYRIKAFTNFASSEYSNIVSVNSLTTANQMVNFPEIFSLSQNYPNPFNPQTTISYSVPAQSHVELRVYDELGREISVLVNEHKPAGEYKVQFDGTSLPSGVYIYSIQAGQYRDSKKLILLK